MNYLQSCNQYVQLTRDAVVLSFTYCRLDQGCCGVSWALFVRPPSSTQKIDTHLGITHVITHDGHTLTIQVVPCACISSSDGGFADRCGKLRAPTNPILAHRDGLERIEVKDGATVGDLRTKIHEQLHIPREDITLSQDAKLVRWLHIFQPQQQQTTYTQLTAKDPSSFTDLANDTASIAAAGLSHGSMVHHSSSYAAHPRLLTNPRLQVYMLYSVQREVEPAHKPTPFDQRPFGTTAKH